MSLLLRERLEVFLAPRQVRVALVRYGFKPRRLLEESLPCDDPDEAGVPPWERAAAALERWLAAHGSRRLDVAVTLSNHFVRYALAPWSEGVSAREERLAVARLQLSGIYGESADLWTLCIDDAEPGVPALSAACDHLLVDRLRALAAGCESRLDALEPWFAAAFNANRRAVRTSPLWYAVLESDRVCAGYFADGAWRVLANETVRHPASDLPQVLERMVLGAEFECHPGPVFVTASGAGSIAPRGGRGWSYHTPSEAGSGARAAPLRVRLAALWGRAA